MSTMRKMTDESVDCTIPSSNPSPNPAADVGLMSSSPLLIPSDLQDSPPHSPDTLFVDKDFEPNLDGPKPGEIAQHRGKSSAPLAKGDRLRPPPAPPADTSTRPRGPHGGANHTVVQTAPFDHDVAPPPEH
ncbi:hypothetical protein RSOLAG22IIIB_01844 [Rhizoctonia solani]|uniref:Uncharacterized protein n=1 Tax=Rhizoctonia solani TaxID=456999 RepID=A0A0K6GBT5_9AGAM|nr:hypothetical protein RSOLAG22IIIB_01844 [Rhizoctonia solani]